MEGERRSNFPGEWTISSPKVGEGGSYLGNDDFSSFYVTAFPIGLLLRVPSYSVGGGGTGSWENLYLYHEELVGNFI